MHPMWRQRRLREMCWEQGIHVSAYSPLGGPGNSWGSTAVVDHPIIQSIALKHQATPAQVNHPKTSINFHHYYTITKYICVCMYV